MELIFFEDIETPSRVEGPSEVIDHDEMVGFARTWDQLSIHVDPAAAGPRGVTACGAFLIAFRMRLIHRMAHQPSVIATFGYDELRFHQPVHAGERLTLVMEYESKRPSRSKPGCGVVSLRESLVNQDGDTVLSMKDTVLVRMRPRD